MSRIPVALQLYSVRDDCKADWPGTLKAVAEMGYDGVEFAGYYDTPAGELRKMLDDLGLQVAGSHIGIDKLSDPEQRKAQVEYAQVIGCDCLIVPWLPEEARNTEEAVIESAKRLNDIAAALKEHEIVTGYHNHWVDFEETGGIVPWYVLFDNCAPEVTVQLDTGHAWRAGADPVEAVKKYPGRSRTVHQKDYSTANGYVPLGEGDLNWKELIAACENEGGAQWHIIEQEECPHGPLETVRRCLDAFRGFLD